MEIGCFDRTFFSGLHQTGYLAAIQAKAPRQGSRDYVLLASLHSIVATSNFDKQNGEGESGGILLAGLTAIIGTCQKSKQPIEHVHP